MKNVSLRLAAVAVALGVAAPAAATNGMRLVGFSPVQNSMGGASAAAPLDAATIVTNPAGMSSLDRRVDISGSGFFASPSYSANGELAPGMPTASGSTISSDRAPDFVPTVAAIYKTSDKLTVGVGAVGMGGLGVDYATDLYGSRTLTSYLNMRVAPAVSYKLANGVAVGAALNLAYAQLEYRVMGAMGNPPREAANSLGYGATFGVAFTTPEKVSLAAVYETRTWFQDFKWDVAGGTEKMQFDQPDVATVGGAFRPMPALLVATDLQWIRWSQTAGTDQPKFTEATPATRPFNMDWKDQFVIKVGAQYDLNKEWALRAGYNYGKHPLTADRAFENIAFPALAQQHYSLGAGYTWRTITVNASVMYVPEVTISGQNLQQGIAQYETKLSQFVADLGATWKF